MSAEPKEFSRAVENLIAGFRVLPEDSSRSKRRTPTDLTALVDELLIKYRISHDSLEHSIREKWVELVGVAYSWSWSPTQSSATNCSCTVRPFLKNCEKYPAVPPLKG